MKPVLCTLLVVMSAAVMPAQSQERIYRCGNEYTNAVPDTRVRTNCKLMEGGNVTVVQGTAVRPVPAKADVSSSSAPPVGGVRAVSPEQKARDADARVILEAELKKTEARQAELNREFNNGMPERRGDEIHNHQKYQDRVAEIKASLARTESDMAGLRRELSRLSSPSAPSASSVTK